MGFGGLCAFRDCPICGQVPPEFGVIHSEYHPKR